MKEETCGMILGIVLLIIGLVILLFVFSSVYNIAQNPSEKLDEWAPEEIKGPTAYFSWIYTNASVKFNDLSVKGDGEITSWQWDFGDSSSSNEENPQHEYPEYGDYTVSLTVEDENGKTSSVDAQVTVDEDSGEGQTQTALSFDLGLGTSFKRFAIITLLVGTFAVLVMIGGRITTAGCHLLRPIPKTLKVKVRRKDMEIEIPEQQKEEIKERN